MDLCTPKSFITTRNYNYASYSKISEAHFTRVVCLCSKKRKKWKERKLRVEVGTRHEMFLFLLSNLLIVFELFIFSFFFHLISPTLFFS